MPYVKTIKEDGVVCDIMAKALAPELDKTLNDRLANKILTFNHTFTLSGGMTAGVIGSRAGQQRYIDPHPEYTLIGLVFINIADSNMYNPNVFYSSGSIYCNWYRASSNSATEEQTTVIVRLVYST